MPPPTPVNCPVCAKEFKGTVGWRNLRKHLQKEHPDQMDQMAPKKSASETGDAPKRKQPPTKKKNAASQAGTEATDASDTSAKLNDNGKRERDATESIADSEASHQSKRRTPPERSAQFSSLDIMMQENPGLLPRPNMAYSTVLPQPNLAYSSVLPQPNLAYSSVLPQPNMAYSSVLPQPKLASDASDNGTTDRNSLRLNTSSATPSAAHPILSSIITSASPTEREPESPAYSPLTPDESGLAERLELAAQIQEELNGRPVNNNKPSLAPAPVLGSGQKPINDHPVQKKVRVKPAYLEALQQDPAYQKAIQQKPVQQKTVQQKSDQQKPVQQKPVQQKPVQEKPVQMDGDNLLNSPVPRLEETILQATDKYIRKGMEEGFVKDTMEEIKDAINAFNYYVSGEENGNFEILDFHLLRTRPLMDILELVHGPTVEQNPALQNLVQEFFGLPKNVRFNKAVYEMPIQVLHMEAPPLLKALLGHLVYRDIFMSDVFAEPTGLWSSTEKVIKDSKSSSITPPLPFAPVFSLFDLELTVLFATALPANIASAMLRSIRRDQLKNGDLDDALEDLATSHADKMYALLKPLTHLVPVSPFNIPREHITRLMKITKPAVRLAAELQARSCKETGMYEFFRPQGFSFPEGGDADEQGDGFVYTTMHPDSSQEMEVADMRGKNGLREKQKVAWCTLPGVVRVVPDHEILPGEGRSRGATPFGLGGEVHKSRGLHGHGVEVHGPAPVAATPARRTQTYAKATVMLQTPLVTAHAPMAANPPPSSPSSPASSRKSSKRGSKSPSVSSHKSQSSAREAMASAREKHKSPTSKFGNGHNSATTSSAARDATQAAGTGPTATSGASATGKAVEAMIAQERMEMEMSTSFTNARSSPADTSVGTRSEWSVLPPTITCPQKGKQMYGSPAFSRAQFAARGSYYNAKEKLGPNRALEEDEDDDDTTSGSVDLSLCRVTVQSPRKYGPIKDGGGVIPEEGLDLGL